jgi:hypothetical protein
VQEFRPLSCFTSAGLPVAANRGPLFLTRAFAADQQSRGQSHGILRHSVVIPGGQVNRGDAASNQPTSVGCVIAASRATFDRSLESPTA